MQYFIFHESWNALTFELSEESPAQHFVAHRSAAPRIDGIPQHRGIGMKVDKD